MKTYSLTSGGPWNMLGKYYWFLADSMDGKKVSFTSNNLDVLIRDLKRTAEKCFLNGTFKFILDKKSNQIFANYIKYNV